MKFVKFNAQPHHILSLDDGTQIHGGESIEVSNERAEHLAKNPHLSIEVFDEKPTGNTQSETTNEEE